MMLGERVDQIRGQVSPNQVDDRVGTAELQRLEGVLGGACSWTFVTATRGGSMSIPGISATTSSMMSYGRGDEDDS